MHLYQTFSVATIIFQNRIYGSVHDQTGLGQFKTISQPKGGGSPRIRGWMDG